MNKWSESVSKPRRQVLEEDGAMVNPTLRCLRVSQRGVYHGILVATLEKSGHPQKHVEMLKTVGIKDKWNR